MGKKERGMEQPHSLDPRPETSSQTTTDGGWGAAWRALAAYLDAWKAAEKQIQVLHRGQIDRTKVLRSGTTGFGVDGRPVRCRGGPRPISTTDVDIRSVVVISWVWAKEQKSTARRPARTKSPDPNIVQTNPLRISPCRAGAVLAPSPRPTYSIAIPWVKPAGSPGRYHPVPGAGGGHAAESTDSVRATEKLSRWQKWSFSYGTTRGSIPCTWDLSE